MGSRCAVGTVRADMPVGGAIPEDCDAGNSRRAHRWFIQVRADSRAARRPAPRAGAAARAVRCVPRRGFAQPWRYRTNAYSGRLPGPAPLNQHARPIGNFRSQSASSSSRATCRRNLTFVPYTGHAHVISSMSWNRMTPNQLLFSSSMICSVAAATSGPARLWWRRSFRPAPGPARPPSCGSAQSGGGTDAAC
jgi:hypothetical protein